jgi:hypothetical protein
MVLQKAVQIPPAICCFADRLSGRIGFQFTRVEFITKSDIKDAGNRFRAAGYRSS